jgi:hypothetical protein
MYTVSAAISWRQSDFRPGHVVEEQVERGPQVRHDPGVEPRIALGVLREVVQSVELEPAMIEGGDLRPRARVGEHALGFLDGVQRPGLRGLEKRRVGKRVPERVREPGGGVVGVAGLTGQVQEARLEGEEDDRLERQLGVLDLGEKAVDEELLQLGGQRPAERALDELSGAPLGVGLREPRPHGIRHFERRVGRRLVPGLGDRRAALVSHAAVVRRERRPHDHGLVELAGAEPSLGDEVLGALRRFPLERRGDELFLLPLKISTRIG